MSRKSKNRSLRIFIWIAFLAAGGFMFLMAYLWWEAEEMKFATYPEFGIPMPYEYEIHGIDVSRYQQKISWKAVRGMQVRQIRLQFAFMKATEGLSNVDSYFSRNWRLSKEAGLTRGAYHFFLAPKDARAQAIHFTRQVQLEPGDLPPVLDIEQSYGVSPDKMRKAVKQWLDFVEGYYGVRPIIYTYIDFYEKNLKGYFDNYPLWVAHYLQPHEPRISRDWLFWQHSEQGRVNGIRTKVDFNVFNGDSLAFRSLLVPEN